MQGILRNVWLVCLDFIIRIFNVLNAHKDVQSAHRTDNAIAVSHNIITTQQITHVQINAYTHA
jgi:hypothetical protein